MTDGKGAILSIFGFLKKTLFAPIKTTLRAGSKRTIIVEKSALLGCAGGAFGQFIAEKSALLGCAGGDRTFIAEKSALLGCAGGDRTFIAEKSALLGCAGGDRTVYSGKIRFIGLHRGQNRRVTWTNEVFCLLH
jgi:hypothetical protein